MEAAFQSTYRQFLLPSHLLHSYHFIPENYVHWTQTPESHIFAAELPGFTFVARQIFLFASYFLALSFLISSGLAGFRAGVRKEEIKVEVEDSMYLIIRTEAVDETGEPARNFLRKFRLPGLIDIYGISAKYENGELKVTVPRSYRRRGFYIEPADVPEQLQLLARAA